MSPYRWSALNALFRSEPGVSIEELDIVAGQVRHALLTNGFAGHPRSKIARIAMNIETDHARPTRKVAEKQGVLAALATGTAAGAGVALKLLVGHEAIAVAGTLAARDLRDELSLDRVQVGVGRRVDPRDAPLRLGAAARELGTQRREQRVDRVEGGAHRRASRYSRIAASTTAESSRRSRAR